MSYARDVRWILIAPSWCINKRYLRTYTTQLNSFILITSHSSLSGLGQFPHLLCSFSFLWRDLFSSWATWFNKEEKEPCSHFVAGTCCGWSADSPAGCEVISRPEPDYLPSILLQLLWLPGLVSGFLILTNNRDKRPQLMQDILITKVKDNKRKQGLSSLLWGSAYYICNIYIADIIYVYLYTYCLYTYKYVYSASVVKPWYRIWFAKTSVWKTSSR